MRRALLLFALACLGGCNKASPPDAMTADTDLNH